MTAKTTAKGITVEKLLKQFGPDDEIVVMLYAYGMYYADTYRNGMRTVAECLEQMNFDCLHAWITGVMAAPIFDGDTVKEYLPEITAEIVHW